MQYSDQIANAIMAYLTKQGWVYDADMVHGTIAVEADLSCRLGSAMVVYQVQEEGFLCYTALPVDVAPAVRAQVGEYLHRANLGLPRGNFEFNYDDGSVQYKTDFDCPGGAPTPKQLEDSLAVGLTVVDHYGDGLLGMIGTGETLAQKLIAELDRVEA